MLEKRTSFHHSVTELGNIQVRHVTEYFEEGVLVNWRYGQPYTPKDINNMAGFDDRSKEIVAAINTKEVRRAFKSEARLIDRDHGLREFITYDRVLSLDGKISIRRITRIFDGKVEVLKRYHRTWIMPGYNFSGADVISKALAVKFHTPETMAAYKKSLLVNLYPV